MKKNYFYSVIRPIITILFKLYYNPIIIGKENIPVDKKIIIAGNHIHNFDAILVGCSKKRNLYFFTKKELFIGPLKIFFSSIGCIQVDRKKKNSESMNLAIKYLENNDAIFIAPEGTRNKTKDILLPFKYGAVSMAKKTNTLIVPYAIVGKYKFRSNDLKIVFASPMDFSKLDLKDANELLYKKVKEMVLENRK